MALPEIRGNARILADLRTGETRTGGTWTSTVVKFGTWKKVDGTWEETDGVIARLSAFDDTATTLAGYAKGDEIGIHGTVKPSVWQDKPQLDISASQIWTPQKPSAAVTATN